MLPSWARRAQADGAKPPWAKRGAKERPLLVEPAKKLARGQSTWASSESLGSRLRCAAFPQWWVLLVLEAAVEAASLPLVVGVEVFSGQGELSKAFCSWVGPFLTFEVRDSPEQDISKTSGLHVLLVMVLRIRLGGLLWLGTPCQSWVALSRSFTQRSQLQVAGPGRQYTTAGQQRYLDHHNRIADITALLARTAHELGIFFVIEQPVSSLLFKYEAVFRVLAAARASTVAFTMSTFQGESPKPLLLKGTGPFLQIFREVVLERRRMSTSRPEKRLADVSTQCNGRKIFTGRACDLKASSGYTPCMGVAMALSFRAWPCDAIIAELEARFGT